MGQNMLRPQVLFLCSIILTLSFTLLQPTTAQITAPWEGKILLIHCTLLAYPLLGLISAYLSFVSISLLPCKNGPYLIGEVYTSQQYYLYYRNYFSCLQVSFLQHYSQTKRV